MDNVRHCRAMGSLFRQFAAFDPTHGWKYLIEAQSWEHRADAEIASYYKQCNSAASEFSEVGTFAANKREDLARAADPDARLIPPT